MPLTWFYLKIMEDRTVMEIKVVPGARKAMIKEENGLWKVYLTAPPAEGKANKFLIEFFSRRLGVPKRLIEITKGLHSRRKTISIYGKFDPTDLLKE